FRTPGDRARRRRGRWWWWWRPRRRWHGRWWSHGWRRIRLGPRRLHGWWLLWAWRVRLRGLLPGFLWLRRTWVRSRLWLRLRLSGLWPWLLRLWLRFVPRLRLRFGLLRSWLHLRNRLCLSRLFLRRGLVRQLRLRGCAGFRLHLFVGLRHCAAPGHQSRSALFLSPSQPRHR